MKKITIFSPGKMRRDWIFDGICFYEKRLASQVAFQWHFNEKIPHPLAINPYIALDPMGHEHCSIDFADFLCSQFTEQGSRLTFLIGGASGLNSEQLKNARYSISLSKMTWPHTLCRLLLIEQIYRAMQIKQNHPYHKYS